MLQRQVSLLVLEIFDRLEGWCCLLEDPRIIHVVDVVLIEAPRLSDLTSLCHFDVLMWFSCDADVVNWVHHNCL